MCSDIASFSITTPKFSVYYLLSPYKVPLLRKDMFGLLCNKKEVDEEQICLTKYNDDGDDDNQGMTNQSMTETDDDKIEEEGQSSNSQTSFHVLNLIQGAFFIS